MNAGNHIDHIGVRVPDLDAAITFFVETLGFSADPPGYGPDGVTPVVFVHGGAVHLEVFELPGIAAAELDHIGIGVEASVADAMAGLGKSGVVAIGGEIDGARGSRAQQLEPSTTLGIRCHLCKR